MQRASDEVQGEMGSLLLLLTCLCCDAQNRLLPLVNTLSSYGMCKLDRRKMKA